ncbi:hypothetical protein XCV0472 [Xanthomonas euvesicatoria pv. vesicatoria str. 85-10]|uniref:Uncharacterized protein n=1 Tax=Xanthomonas euvesicatoria pv. vesicatoria (strain 85-10) TaxID=316273 RepID=Q3BYG0_XANE5|nr:hypothetical protein XCV0472 [Xanthomonas euvesicatoria pv. vesicatoria str. 85-10]
MLRNLDQAPGWLHQVQIRSMDKNTAPVLTSLALSHLSRCAGSRCHWMILPGVATSPSDTANLIRQACRCAFHQGRLITYRKKARWEAGL